MKEFIQNAGIAAAILAAFVGITWLAVTFNLYLGMAGLFLWGLFTFAVWDVRHTELALFIPPRHPSRLKGIDNRD